MSKIIITKGLPASGKSTWAKEQLAKNSKIKRVNKDDLRAMIDNSQWSQTNEKFVLKIRDIIVREALKNGNDIIVDDTNLHCKHITRLKQIANELKVKIEINDSFLEVPVEECINRDKKRPNSVGQEVILDMYNKFIKKSDLAL